MWLSDRQARVVGALVEKHLATPQQYPLTLNALLAACNQATSRDPVVDYDEPLVLSVIDELKQAKLVRSVLPSAGRSVVRYRHVLDEALGLDPRQCALVAVMLLRGPQTVSELRIRTDRMAEFDDLGEVARELEWLATRDEPLARNVGRRPGQKEERWACPLVTPAAEPMASSGRDESPSDDGPVTPSTRHDPMEALRTELEALRAEVSDLSRELHELRASLGD